MQEHEVRAVVAAVLAEQEKSVDIDATVLKTVATILKSFGISDDDRIELQADFVHLRKWRKSVEEAQSLGFKIVVTTICTGLLGALGVGIKSWLGK
ncbi:hypothetical protein [Bradyrhizobium sp.]|jgi:hypothetical protein|uniref:hypothetical protein n=1 Tax=Bradyrhizobium sp. TaxID=376 RepID=UPI002DDC9505|nr:hypothetical protein [Bradyrhizobium sp.]HEV2155415.1 hypothetical protein [Bradyrhizobium sp.]